MPRRSKQAIAQALFPDPNSKLKAPLDSLQPRLMRRTLAWSQSTRSTAQHRMIRTTKRLSRRDRKPFERGDH
jgi:hypothetical protein